MGIQEAPKQNNFFRDIVVFSIGIVIGVLLMIFIPNKTNHEQPVTNLQPLFDSINKIAAKSDSTIIIQTNEIRHEKGKLTERFITIDSLPYDSLYIIWAIEARQYKPIYQKFN